MKVLAYKSGWLAQTETFIRDQLDALDGVDVSTLGLYRVLSSNCRPDDSYVTVNRRAGKALRLLLSYARFTLPVRRRIEEMAPDLVHVHFATEGRGLVRVLARLDIPYVVTCHGNDVTGPQTIAGIHGHLVRRQTRCVLQGAAAVVAVSQFCADMAIACGARSSHVVVLPTGTKITPKVEQADKEFDLVFVGRLMPVKGVDHLIRATALANLKDDLRLRVLIVGDGPEMHNCQQLAARLGVHASFIGSVRHDQVPRHLSRGRIFVAPSTVVDGGTREGFGMVYLEAALQELPIIAYDSGGVSEAVDHRRTGILVREADVDALSEAIRELVHDKDMCRVMGEQGRRRVIENFDIATQADKLRTLYLRAVGAEA